MVPSGRDVKDTHPMCMREKIEWQTHNFLQMQFQRVYFIPFDGSMQQMHRRRSLLVMFQDLESAYLYLVMVLIRVCTRIEHLRRALGAVETRQAAMKCRLGVKRRAAEFAAELAIRREEEKLVLEDIHATAVEITELGEL
ncbi:hypothetical protein DFH11DRAFT_1725710 [Phellopilus nigrolimitatus]|nr:hypothetical protein DFH11DRAFT_1725710 [Phellopilus nigrolimitatus]